MITKQLLLAGMLATGFIACKQRTPVNEQKDIQTTTVMPDSIAVVPFQLENGGGWGFDIQFNGKTRIHQEFIPVIPGYKAFQSREDAMKVGDNLVAKIKKYHTGFPDIKLQELVDMDIQGLPEFTKKMQSNSPKDSI